MGQTVKNRRFEKVKTRAKKSKLMTILKPSKAKMIILAVIVVAGVAAVKLATKKTSTQVAEASVDVVTRGDVELSITGSASVEPNERFEIISMVSGDIVSSPYEVGDTVREGDILYQFDTSDTDISMEKQKLSLQQSEISYNDALDKKEDLTVSAPCNGVISGLNFKVGDTISMSEQVAQISNSRVMKVVLPFNENQTSEIWTGLSAYITSSANMGVFEGKVVEVSSNPVPQEDGSKLYDVTIEFDNPGAINDGQLVGGAVNGMISPGYGKVEYSEKGTAKADAAGTVSKVYVSNGDYVQKGQNILKIESEDISKSIENSSISYKNAKLSLQEQQKKLEDYSIKSPISGTVITKNAKAGDTIDKTNSTTVLMVVADVSKLKFKLNIDELDVSKVNEGQTVEITCDALPSEVFYGVIDNVSVEGTATNGVTTYSAEVIIDEPGNLRPSMNVDATIIIESAQNVLRVPTSDIKSAMGRSFVFVKDANANNEFGKDEQKGGKNAENEKMPPEGNDTHDGPQNNGGEGFGHGDTPPENMEEMPDKNENAGEVPSENMGAKSENRGAALPEAPQGFKAVEIVTGISGEDFTEVVSGLSEGDEIYSMSVSTSSDNSFGGMGGNMGGGMPGGGMGGNMGGGMPGGGMGGGPR